MAVASLPIRQISLDNITIGGESKMFSTKPVFALELNIFNFDDSSHLAKDYFGTDKSPQELIKKAQNANCANYDILALKFNIPDENLEENISKAENLLNSLLPIINKPLLIRGVNNNDIDKILLPRLIKILDRKSIVAFANEKTYEKIVPEIIKGNHILAIRTPIDINLAKEMNILTSDMGLNLNNILIDTDMGGLGYGLEYGYSVMEKIKLAALNGDKMLNMPLIAFAGEEALKLKEAKSDNLPESFGDFKERSKMFELTTAIAVIQAGANLIVLQTPENVMTLKSLFC